MGFGDFTWFFSVWARRLKKSQKLKAEETCKVTLSQIAPTMYFLIQSLPPRLQSPVKKSQARNQTSTASVKCFLNSLEIFASFTKTEKKNQTSQ